MDRPFNCLGLSNHSDILGLQTFFALAHGKFNALPFIQGAVAVALDRGVVDEDIATLITRYEAVALGGVKPLYRTGFTL